MSRMGVSGGHLKQESGTRKKVLTLQRVTFRPIATIVRAMPCPNRTRTKKTAG